VEIRLVEERRQGVKRTIRKVKVNQWYYECFGLVKRHSHCDKRSLEEPARIRTINVENLMEK
jgi:hypothetical protein